MKFVVRIFHFVEVVHTYVMSSVSESLDIILVGIVTPIKDPSN